MANVPDIGTEVDEGEPTTVEGHGAGRRVAGPYTVALLDEDPAHTERTQLGSPVRRPQR